jgi:hypothetical protein
MFKGVSQCMPTVACFTLVHLIPSIILPYTFTPTPVFQQLSVHILIVSTFTGVTYYNIVDDALSFLKKFVFKLHNFQVLRPEVVSKSLSPGTDFQHVPRFMKFHCTVVFFLSFT